MDLEVIVVLDSRDVYTSLRMQHQSIDRPVVADFNNMRYQFDVGNTDQIQWISGRLDLADPDKKPENLLMQALQLLLFSEKLPLVFPELEATNFKEKPFGKY